MDEILNKSMAEMAGLSFDCSCGRRHLVDIRKIIIGSGIMDDIAATVKEFSDGKKVFFIADNNTYAVYGEKVEQRLLSEKVSLKSFVFNSSNPLIPDDKAIGSLLLALPADASLIVTVGSGTLNDLTRMLSLKTRVPYIVVATAPSMDGYASVVSPLIVDKFKVTLDGVYPIAILGDLDVIKEAPMHMLYAGFGDMLGKLTAVPDWDLAVALHNEYYCGTSIKLVQEAVKKCIDNIEGIKNRDVNAVRYVMEGLVLSGIAIGIVGHSRPASGAEHHIAHYWEIDAVKKDQEHALHGNCVGVGTVIYTLIHEMMKGKLPIETQAPSSEYITGLLSRLGAAKTPVELGITREVFTQSILGAKDVRPRFSILHIAHEHGRDLLPWKQIIRRFPGLYRRTGEDGTEIPFFHQ